MSADSFQATSPTDPAAGGRVRRILGRPAARAASMTVAFHAGAMLVNIVTGVLVARELGAAGRGELAAILTATQVMALLGAVGAMTAVPYHQARHPDDARRLIGTWLVLAPVLGGVTALVAQLVLPVVLGAQSDDTLSLARVYVTTTVLLVLSDAMFGFVLGAHRFLLYNCVRLGAPAATAAGYVVLALTDNLPVAGALAVTAGVNAVVVLGACVWAVVRFGVARPDRALARRTLWFGARAQATTLAERAIAQLDLFILPAFVAAAAVGLYSVATNLALIVAVLCGAVARIVLPLAARDPGRSSRTVVTALHATIVLGAVLAGTLALIAPTLIDVLYGDQFHPSVKPMRILLPGAVLYGGTTVLVSGLYALERPATAAVPQAIGAAVTVVGLLLFLSDGGIEAAALISTLAYATAFAVALVTYRRTVGTTWSALLPRWPRP